MFWVAWDFSPQNGQRDHSIPVTQNFQSNTEGLGDFQLQAGDKTSVLTRASHKWLCMVLKQWIVSLNQPCNWIYQGLSQKQQFGDAILLIWGCQYILLESNASLGVGICLLMPSAAVFLPRWKKSHVKWCMIILIWCFKLLVFNRANPVGKDTQCGLDESTIQYQVQDCRTSKGRRWTEELLSGCSTLPCNLLTLWEEPIQRFRLLFQL